MIFFTWRSAEGRDQTSIWLANVYKCSGISVDVIWLRRLFMLKGIWIIEKGSYLAQRRSQRMIYINFEVSHVLWSASYYRRQILCMMCWFVFWSVEIHVVSVKLTVRLWNQHGREVLLSFKWTIRCNKYHDEKRLNYNARNKHYKLPASSQSHQRKDPYAKEEGNILRSDLMI